MRTRFVRRLRAAPGVVLGCVLLSPASAGALPSNTPDSDPFVTNGPVRAIEHAGNRTYIGGDFTELRAQTGSGVRFNATTGQRVTPVAAVEGNSSEVYASVPDGAGGYYIGGDFTSVGGVPRNGIARIRSNGSVDPVFNPNANSSVTALEVSNGVLYAGGHFTAIGGLARSHLAKLSATTGNAVGGWRPDPSGGITRVNAIAVSGSAVYVGGNFQSIGGQTRESIAKLSAASGAVDPAFNAGDVVSTSPDIFDLAASGSAVYVSGFFTGIGGESRNGIAKLSLTSGKAFSSFDPNPGPPPQGSTVSALLLSGSHLYAGGNFTTIGGQPRTDIAKLSAASGNAVSGFDPGTNGGVQALALSSSTLYVGGHFSTIAGRNRNGIAKLSTASGNAFSSFDPNVDGTFFSVVALASSGSHVYAGGTFETANPVTRNRIAQLDSGGTPTAWNANADNMVRAIRVSPSGSEVYVGGDFENIGGQGRSRIAKLSATSGNAFSAWNPSADAGRVSAIEVDSSGVYAAGSFTTLGGQPRNRIAKLSATSGNAFSSFNPNASPCCVIALELDGSALYVGGGFTNIGGQPRNRIAKLSATSGNAFSAWNPGANLPVSALEASGSALYAGGDFNGANSIGGQARNHIAKLSTASGNVFSAFNPGADASVFDLALSGSQLYAGGDFTTIGGQSRDFLAALNSAGDVFTGFDPNLNGSFVAALEATADRLYVGGDFTEVGGQPRRGYAQFSQP